MFLSIFKNLTERIQGLTSVPNDSDSLLTVKFNRAAGHIEGRLIKMTEDEVAQIHQNFVNKIETTLNNALPKDCNPSKRAALKEYALALSRTRQKVSPKKLECIAALDIDDIEAKTRTILSKLSELDSAVDRELNSKKENKTDRHDSADPFFAKQERLYFKLKDNSVSSAEPFVKAFLQDHGYTVTDYSGGYASNDGGKNIIKIGKILKSLDTPEGMITSYIDDPCRIQKNLIVILSRNATDIARGSHERAWKSCRTDAGSAASNGINEYYAGVIAAYLVTEEDPDIHNPLGRLFLKPFDSTEGRYDNGCYIRGNEPTVYFTFNPIGIHIPAFSDAVNNFADQNLNGDHFGTFYKRTPCESYRETPTRTRLPANAKTALQKLDIDFQETRSGKIRIKGDLNISGLGLSKLPDMQQVEVTGTIDVSNNKLLSLAGLPQNGVQRLKADQTLISSFYGSPPKIRGDFSYFYSAYLTSTCGKPKADRYIYGGNHYGEGVEKSEICIGPMEEPKKFIRFKR